jgi:hypothetical protein
MLSRSPLADSGSRSSRRFLAFAQFVSVPVGSHHVFMFEVVLSASVGIASAAIGAWAALRVRRPPPATLELVDVSVDGAGPIPTDGGR